MQSGERLIVDAEMVEHKPLGIFQRHALAFRIDLGMIAKSRDIEV